jgi:hypothetical protein
MSYKDIYSIAVTIITIMSIIVAIYNKVKFVCLQKASEMVASAEGETELKGSEKFALVVTWINSDLPKLFKNTLFQTILKNLIQFAYNNSYTYAKKYIKNKTGLDISTIIEQIKEESEED